MSRLTVILVLALALAGCVTSEQMTQAEKYDLIRRVTQQCQAEGTPNKDCLYRKIAEHDRQARFNRYMTTPNPQLTDGLRDAYLINQATQPRNTTCMTTGTGIALTTTCY